MGLWSVQLFEFTQLRTVSLACLFCIYVYFAKYIVLLQCPSSLCWNLFSPFSLELTPLHCILEDIALICTLAGRQGLIGTCTEDNCWREIKHNGIKVNVCLSLCYNKDHLVLLEVGRSSIATLNTWTGNNSTYCHLISFYTGPHSAGSGSLFPAGPV